MEAEASMRGKVCLVTGATSGIGAVTALELARQGAEVILVGRSRERCEAAAERIQNATGRPDVEYLLADLSSQKEIRRLADEVRRRHSRLDVLVNNAGGMFTERRESVDGIELTFALNHLAYFLLTNLLTDMLKASAPARVVSVASDAHRWARGIDFDNLQLRRRYGMFRAYGRSKLANVLFTTELARRLAGTGVTANALHPGFVATNFFEGDEMIARLMRVGARLFAIAPEEGAKTSVYLAGAPAVAGLTGKYFERCRAKDPSPAARDRETAARLWEVSEELTRSQERV